MSAQILLVIDDPTQRRQLEAVCLRLGHDVAMVDDGAAALARLSAPDGGRFDLMIVDLVMPELDGLGVLRRLPETGRRLKVIVQVSAGGIDGVSSAIRAGASDFLVKPASPERIEVSVQNVVRARLLENEIARSSRAAVGTVDLGDILAASPAMDRVIALGRRAAGSALPILIEGETGVGKGLIARAIHGASDRRSKPFLAVDCAATPAHRLDALLFGQGAGASGDRQPGKVQLAHGGTLLLDEIGDLCLDAQAKLLGLLQAGEIEPAGAKRALRTDVRLIATSSRDLIARVTQGLFREELYYRLTIQPIRVPPLRERREDIPELVRHFTARFAAEARNHVLHGVDAAALQRLTHQAWPGNVRQLENAVFRAVVLAEGPLLTVDDLPHVTTPAMAASPVQDRDLPPILFERPAMVATMPSAAPIRPGHIPALGPDGDVRPLVEIEAAMIELALERYRGRMATVARKLGIGRSTLYRKLKELAIAGDEEKIAAE